MNEFYPYDVDSVRSSIIWKTAISPTYKDEKRESLLAVPRLRLRVVSFLAEDEIQHAFAILQGSEGHIRMPDWRLSWYGRYSSSFPWPADYRNVEIGDAVCVLKGCELFEAVIVSADTDGVELSPSFDGMNISVCPIWNMKLISEVTVTPQSSISASISFTLMKAEYQVFNHEEGSLIDGHPTMLQRNTVRGSSMRLNLNRNQDDSAANTVSLTRDRVRDQSYGSVSFEVDAVDDYIDREREISSFEGKSKPFWLPTWGQDFKLETPTQFGDFQITCFPRNYDISDRLDAIAISSKGTTRVYQVELVSANSRGINITLKTPIVQQVSPDELNLTISRANLVRFDTDEFNSTVTGEVFQSSLSTVEVLT